MHLTTAIQGSTEITIISYESNRYYYTDIYGYWHVASNEMLRLSFCESA